MLLCLDVGNSQIFGGVFQDKQLKLRFRRDNRKFSTSDELGIFLKSVLRENNIDEFGISDIAICSVVPQIDYSLRAACKKYFDITPFVLDSQAQTGLVVEYRNPLEVGSDRLANAIGAIHYHPEQNIIIADFGTATTFCAISKEKVYMGGAIMAGLRISMESLQERAAKLPFVEIVKPDSPLGRSTTESLQAGLYYGHLGSVKEMIGVLREQCYGQAPCMIIGTGGFAHLYDKSGVFTVMMPDLVLDGLRLAHMVGQKQTTKNHDVMGESEDAYN